MNLFYSLPFALLLSLAATQNAFAQSASEALDERQRDEVRQIIGEYLRDNPEIILEAIQQLRDREQARQHEQAQTNLVSYRDQIERDPSSPVAGNPDGDVTIVEFFDYRCGYCKQMLPAVRALLRADKNVRYVFKEFPILSPESEIAARAALAAWQQSPPKYFKLHTKLMEAQGSLSERQILRIAETVGLDANRIKQDMNSPEIARVLESNKDLASRLGIQGTPGFVIGDRIVPGAISPETLNQLVAEARGN